MSMRSCRASLRNAVNRWKACWDLGFCPSQVQKVSCLRHVFNDGQYLLKPREGEMDEDSSLKIRGLDVGWLGGPRQELGLGVSTILSPAADTPEQVWPPLGR